MVVGRSLLSRTAETDLLWLESLTMSVAYSWQEMRQWTWEHTLFIHFTIIYPGKQLRIDCYLQVHLGHTQKETWGTNKSVSVLEVNLGLNQDMDNDQSAPVESAKSHSFVTWMKTCDLQDEVQIPHIDLHFILCANWHVKEEEPDSLHSGFGCILWHWHTFQKCNRL